MGSGARGWSLGVGDDLVKGRTGVQARLSVSLVAHAFVAASAAFKGHAAAGNAAFGGFAVDGVVPIRVLHCCGILGSGGAGHWVLADCP